MPPRLSLEDMAAIGAAASSDPPVHASGLARELGLTPCSVYMRLSSTAQGCPSVAPSPPLLTPSG